MKAEKEHIDELIVSIQGEDRWSIDTVEINRMILRKEGLKNENIRG